MRFLPVVLAVVLVGILVGCSDSGGTQSPSDSGASPQCPIWRVCNEGGTQPGVDSGADVFLPQDGMPDNGLPADVKALDAKAHDAWHADAKAPDAKPPDAQIADAMLADTMPPDGTFTDGTAGPVTKGSCSVDKWCWHNPLPQGNGLSHVWGSGASDIYAVGYNGTVIHYDGTVWSSMTSGTTEDLYGVWGSGSSDVFAVGTKGTILHYDGLPHPRSLEGLEIIAMERGLSVGLKAAEC